MMIDLGVYKVVEKDDEFKNIVFLNIGYHYVIYLSYDDNYDKFELGSKWNVFYYSFNNMYLLKQYNKPKGITFIYKPIGVHLEQIML